MSYRRLYEGVFPCLDMKTSTWPILVAPIDMVEYNVHFNAIKNQEAFQHSFKTNTASIVGFKYSKQIQFPAEHLRKLAEAVLARLADAHAAVDCASVPP